MFDNLANFTSGRPGSLRRWGKAAIAVPLRVRTSIKLPMNTRLGDPTLHGIYSPTDPVHHRGSTHSDPDEVADTDTRTDRKLTDPC